MTYTATRAVAFAESQVGFHEVPDGSNCNPYSDWQYGVRCPGGGWCISFASRCTVEGGYVFDGATHGARGFSYTESAEAWARARGLWRDKWWKAAPGDWFIFDWGNGGPTDHGEVCHTDEGNKVVLIGGNTSNAVKYRTRDRQYVVGIVAFSQSPQAVPDAPPPPVWKVMPMFDPALIVTARLHHPGGGWWEGYVHGRVQFLSPTGAVLEQGMNSAQERKDWGDRVLARLIPRTRNDGKPGFSMVATDGARYVPEEQR